MIWVNFSVVIAWITFWIGRTLIIVNDQEFYYKKGKICKKKEMPWLFRAEVMASLLWVIFGAIYLYSVFYGIV